MEQRRVEGFGDRPSGSAYETSPLASCFWCGTAHPAAHPLSVCPSCLAMYQVRRFPMGRLGMIGPFPLDDEVIDEEMSRTSPGNYALGYMDGTTFLVFYVGRSDCDVKGRLHEWVGTPSRFSRYASAAKAAWNTRRHGPLPLDVPAQGRVGIGVESGYTRFAYSYASSADTAFEKECRNFDDFGGSEGLDNVAHPVSTRYRSGESLRSSR